MPDNNDCTRCRLAKTRTKIVFATPCPPGGLLAIGEAPGSDEDTVGEGFIGPAGRRLDELLVLLECHRGLQYGVANIVRCRPPNKSDPNKDRKPVVDQIRACIPFLAGVLASARPSVVLLVGGTAADALLGKNSLLEKVMHSRINAHCDFRSAHPALRNEIKVRHPDLWERGISAVPMPHTSGRSWNRKATDGQPWSDVGTEQVRLAVSLLTLSHDPKHNR